MNILTYKQYNKGWHVKVVNSVYHDYYYWSEVEIHIYPHLSTFINEIKEQIGGPVSWFKLARCNVSDVIGPVKYVVKIFNFHP